MSIESRTCEHVEALGGVDTPEEREAFLKWWEGQAHWSGSACAVAYQGWLAARADSDDQLRALGHVERQRDELAAENAALRGALTYYAMPGMGDNGTRARVALDGLQGHARGGGDVEWLHGCKMQPGECTDATTVFLPKGMACHCGATEAQPGGGEALADWKAANPLPREDSEEKR